MRIVKFLEYFFTKVTPCYVVKVPLGIPIHLNSLMALAGAFFFRKGYFFKVFIPLFLMIGIGVLNALLDVNLMSLARLGQLVCLAGVAHFFYEHFQENDYYKIIKVIFLMALGLFFLEMYYPGFSAHKTLLGFLKVWRVNGIIGEPNFSSALISSLAVLAFSGRRFWYIPLAVILVVGFGSRGAILAFMFWGGMQLVLLLSKNVAKKLLLISLVLIMLAPLWVLIAKYSLDAETLQRINTLTAERLSIYLVHLRASVNSVWGNGYFMNVSPANYPMDRAFAGFQFAISNIYYQSHNLFIQVLSSFGILGYLFFITFLFNIYRIALRRSTQLAISFTVLLINFSLLNGLCEFIFYFHIAYILKVSGEEQKILHLPSWFVSKYHLLKQSSLTLAKKVRGKVFKSIAYLVLENVLRLSVGFALSVWVARYLGVVTYGMFSYVISLVLIFTPFFVMGNDEISIKKLIDEPERHNEIMGTSFVMKLLGGIVGYCMCMIVIALINPTEQSIRILVAIYGASMLFKSFDNINNWYQAKVEPQKISMTRNAIFLVTSAMKLGCLVYRFEWEWFIYISALEVVLFGFVYNFVYLTDKRSLFSWRMYKGKFGYFAKNSIPVFVIAFLVMALARTDQIMIRELVGNHSLGRYAVAVKLVDLWQFLPLAIVGSFYPGLVAAYERSEAEYNNKTIELFSILFWLSIVFATCVNIVALPLIKFLYDPTYWKAGELLPWYAWLSVFTFFTLARIKSFVIEGKISIGIALVGLTLAINLLMNFWLIPKYDAFGAIYASLSAYSLANVIMTIINKTIRVNNIRFIKAWFYPFKFLMSQHE